MVSRTNDMMGFYEQKFNDNIHELRCLIEENIEAIKEYIIDFESSIQHRSDPAHNIHRLNGEIGSQLLSCMGDTNQIWLRNYKKYSQIVCSIQIIIKLLNDTLQILIENCLGNWKRDQIVAGFGDGNIKVPSNLHDRNAQLKSALDDIQQKFEVLFEYALHTRALLNDIHNCHSQLHYVDTLAMEASQETTGILHNLIQSSFIIDEQPPQVINKDKKFEASVRLLLAKFVVNEFEPEATVLILSESQTRSQQSSSLPFDQSQLLGEISNNKCSFEISSLPNQRLVWFFRNMQVKNIKRAERRAFGSVMDEKYSLFFQSTIRFDNMPFNVWTTSLPLTVAVHVSQDAEGWATVIWDNSFYEVSRMPFVVPNAVSWLQMEWALSMRFHYQTGCTLTEEHLQYFYEKIFGPSPKHDRLITWTQFCKNPLPGREFTFFHWFHDATKLTRSHLSKQWNKGLICGFISKDQAQKMLLKCAPGTFLLRFSDSQLGGISVAWVEKNDDDSLTVTHLEPFLSYDFENTKPCRSIGDFIEHISYCTHLYPDIPKHEAFGEFYTQVKRKSLEVYKAKQRFF